MSLKQEFELLRRVPLFAEVEPSRLKLLAFMSERVGFDPGKLIMRQGDPARCRLSDHRGARRGLRRDARRAGDPGDRRRQ